MDMSRDGELHRLIRIFLDYELPEIQEFRHAQSQFKTDLPTVLENLRATVAEAEADNPEYQEAASSFLDLCRRTIGPAVSPADVREMLLQHILTKDIFLSIFREDQFHRENNVARQLDRLERTFFTGDVRRQAIDRLRAYYGVIGRAADEIADYAEKQQFLKAIYEDFYTAYNPAAADRLGVVYTPNEVVDFIIRGADHLLQKHFGKTLADDNVQILDPATGTGTFITTLINHLPADRLEHKYLNEIHANEVAILPYYIANLNIEYTYQQRTGRYLEFPNLCFVDTLDNLDWQGATGGAVTRQGAFNLGGLSEENWIRIQEQNEKPISVIIGNPPYNANQQNWNDNNQNREYTEIDRRIRETYIAGSTAQKTKQYDMYKRFIRWASDRLADDGIVGFVSNSAFLDARQDDGFRKVVAGEFNELWVLDLKGNARTSGERRRREGGNVFDDKIRVGVAVYFLVRREGLGGFKVFYNAVDDYVRSPGKVEYVKNASLAELGFDEIMPDAKGNWISQSNTNFEGLLPLADRQTKTAKSAAEERAVFKLNALGINTARDEWVYEFDVPSLREKVLFFADAYNGFLDADDKSYPPVIKWSRDLRNEFNRGRRIVYNDAHRVRLLYRPFVVKHHFANSTMNDVLTRNHYEMFGEDFTQQNRVLNLCSNGKYFYTLASDKLTDWHFTGDTQCLPLYRYTGDGERVSNITQWGIDRINGHYRQEWGDDFQELAGEDGITAEQIFAYTYAVLHNPAYRHEYAVDLLREFPRLPLYPDFHHWAERCRPRSPGPCPAPTPVSWRRCPPPGRRPGTRRWRAGCPACCGRGRPAWRGSGWPARSWPRTCPARRASTRSPRRASTASRPRPRERPCAGATAAVPAPVSRRPRGSGGKRPPGRPHRGPRSPGTLRREAPLRRGSSGAGRWWSGAGPGWPAPASTMRSRRVWSGRGQGPRRGTSGASCRSHAPTTPAGRGRRPSSARSCGTGRWTATAARPR